MVLTHRCRRYTEPATLACRVPQLTLKAVVIDIDGTLAPTSGELTTRVKRAVAEAKSKGLVVALATGRRYISAKPFIDALQLDGPVIVAGGAVICDSRTGEVLYEETLPANGLASATDAIRDAGLQPLLRGLASHGHPLHAGHESFDNEPTTIYVHMEPAVQRWEHHLLRRVPNIMLALGLSHDELLLHRLAAQIAALPGLSPLVLPFGPGVLPSAAIDVFKAGTGKARALGHLSAELGFSASEVMAIGDGINDLDLLEAVGLPVAVANAIPEARARAKVVVGSNDEDGVAEAIEQFVLHEGRTSLPASGS